VTLTLAPALDASTARTGLAKFWRGAARREVTHWSRDGGARWSMSSSRCASAAGWAQPASSKTP